MNETMLSSYEKGMVVCVVASDISAGCDTEIFCWEGENSQNFGPITYS